MEFKKVRKRAGRSHPSRAPESLQPKTPASTSASRSRQSHRSAVRAFIVSKKAIGLLALLIIVALVISTQRTTRNQETAAETNSQAESSQASKSASGNPTTPEYKTVLPQGKDIKALGGWRRVSPITSTPVFAYVDKIGAVPINVSQQPLPESFKSDTDSKVSELATTYNATSNFTVGSTKVHIGTSAKGPQSVIFTSKQLLILIKSQKTIDTKAWTDYIATLQ
jgi:cytoskeletal protein RodZ